MVARMDTDPIRQFGNWYREAEQANIALPNAMTLATSSPQGNPSARVVLLKKVDERGFVFFTNYQSRKAQELEMNPLAALVFYWPPLSRQVRVEGRVEKLLPVESDEYFASRPQGHQIAAHASPQSQVVMGRQVLDEQFQVVARKFEGQVVPRPEHWGGYLLVPESLEFWQQGENRVHDRLRYRRVDAGSWVMERLAP